MAKEVADAFHDVKVVKRETTFLVTMDALECVVTEEFEGNPETFYKFVIYYAVEALIKETK